MNIGIDKFTGTWISEDNFRIEILKIDNTLAEVSLYNPKGNPIIRPYFDNKLTIKMPAIYDDFYDEFNVKLWEDKSGFELNFIYEANYALDPLKRESIVPSLTRYAEDNYLDQYYALFGNLNHFVKIPKIENEY